MGDRVAADVSWWETFFAGGWSELQPLMWTDEESEQQADLVHRLLQLASSSSILDVPCGEGRIARRLAARGYRVTGVDLSASILEVARARAAADGASVVWEQRDMRDLPWEGEFDGVVCWWGSFGYFDDSANAAMLRAVSRSLKPGGRLVLDTMSMETLLPNFSPRSWFEVGDVVVLQDREFDHAAGRIEEDWTMIEGGRRRTVHSSMRVYAFVDIAAMLQAAGFSDVRGIDRVSEEPFGLGSRRLVVVATKQAGGVEDS